MLLIRRGNPENIKKLVCFAKKALTMTVWVVTKQDNKLYKYFRRFMRNNQAGFTLIELLIAIAIIGILTALALPSYQSYTRKARYTEIIQAGASFKIGVEECYQAGGDLQECYAGKDGVPDNIEAGLGVGLVDSVIASNGGVITITPRNLHGIKSSDTYILTPEVKNNNQLVWTRSGGGVTSGYAK